MTAVVGRTVADWGTEATPVRQEGLGPVMHVPGQSQDADDLWRIVAGEDLGFYGWLLTVYEILARRTGLGLLCLPDRGWYEDYEGRVRPEEAADYAQEEFAEEYGEGAL